MAFVSSFTAPVVPARLAPAICGAQIAHAAAPARAMTRMASVPAAPTRSRTRMANASRSMPFMTVPKGTVGLLGSVDFDPLGLSSAMDVRWMQEAEIKHGRVCMLAVIGLIVPEFVHLPDPAFSFSLPTEAFFNVPQAGLAQILIFIGALEMKSHKGKVGPQDMDLSGIPGDLGFNPLGLKFDEKMRLRELKHCRLAMVGSAGLLHQAMNYKIGVVAALTNGLPTWPY